MNPHELLVALWAEGVTVRLAPGGKNLAAAGRLTPGQRDLVIANKPSLIDFLASAHTTTVLLIQAAMRRCDQFNDGDEARQEMRQQCLELPPQLQLDLLQHFQGKPVKFSN